MSSPESLRAGISVDFVPLLRRAHRSPQAFLERALFFLQIVDHIQLVSIDPPSEHHQQQVERLK